MDVPRFVVPGLVLTCALLRAASARAEPFHVCALSLNAPDELRVFETALPADDFEIVDLGRQFLPTAADASVAPVAAGDTAAKGPASSLAGVCRPDLRCDVVVFAGEFAGRFFGSSGRSVTLEELEEASCQPRCAGLFDPEEVFLLACNTLATKDEDSRTPREYLQVLLDHGFDQASAERVVELRYGPLGPSFRESLRRIFAGVPRLYGFSSIAPRAEFTAPRLARYFRAKGDYARWLEDARGEARPNRELLAAFGGTDLVQTTGLRPTDRGAADRALVCRVYDDGRSVRDRLDVVGAMVERPDFLSFVPTLEVFFNRHPPDAFRDGERDRFAAIQANANARTKVLGLVRDLQVSAVKMEIAHLARQLDWMSAEAFHGLAVGGARELLRQPLTSEVVDIMCEIAKHETIGGEIRSEELPDRLFRDAEGIRLLDCLAPTDHDVTPRLLAGLRVPDEATRLWAAYALSRRLPLPDDVLRDLATFADDPSPAMRARVGWVLQAQRRPEAVRTADRARDGRLAARF
jgi:hypothetical protein